MSIIYTWQVWRGLISMPIRALSFIEVESEHCMGADSSAFCEVTNRNIERLNRLIERYNHELTKPVQNRKLKARLLNQLDEELSALNDTSITTFLNASMSFFDVLNKQLFEDIQAERGVFMINLRGAVDISASGGTVDISASAIIENMSPEDLQALSRALPYGSDKAAVRHNIHTLNEVLTDPEFRLFLKANEITVCSHENGLNLKITPHAAEEKSFVLQFEDRMDISSAAERHLRKGILSNFFSILAKRTTTIPSASKEVPHKTYNVKVLPFYSGGDLVSYFMSPTFSSPEVPIEVRILAVIDTYQQMAEYLALLESEGCVTTDMKNSNWLRDQSGNLGVVDTKGFQFSNQEGVFDHNDTEGFNGLSSVYAYSNHLRPPEGWEDQPLVESSHAYMLGANIYQGLTGCGEGYFSGKKRGEQKRFEAFDFEQPIFQTKAGAELKKLVVNLMSEEPCVRYPAIKVCEELKKIKAMMQPDLAAAKPSLAAAQPAPRKSTTLFEQALSVEGCRLLLDQFAEYKLTGEEAFKDSFITKYMKEMDKKLEQPDLTPVACQALRRELNVNLRFLKKSQPLVEDVERLIEEGRLDGQDKGRRIRSALAATPFQDRATIPEGNTEKKLAVLQAMAEHRNPRLQSLLPGNRSAKTFRDFKAMYTKTRADLTGLGQAADAQPGQEHTLSPKPK
jgi:hypothetical protein